MMYKADFNDASSSISCGFTTYATWILIRQKIAIDAQPANLANTAL